MITKTCKNCGKEFACGTGTHKPASDKFCGGTCSDDYYKDCPKLPPPSGCRI